jgi:hypothetical protein
VLHGLIELFLYALLASFSALALAVTVVVLRAGRVKSLAFGIGFVAGQLSICALLVLVGVAATGSAETGHHTIQAVVELALAVLLVGVALRVRRTDPVDRAATRDRGRRILERLARLRTATMLVAGVVLGIGGPKRFVLTALAATAITTSGTGGADEASLVVWYSALATAVVWAPVLLYLGLGAQVVEYTALAEERLARHQRETVVYALVLVAALLVVDAITAL